MKLSDYVANFLAEQGIKHIFGLTGGGAVHLFDSFARHPNIRPIFTHHEQAVAMAAEAYARVSDSGVGAACVTTGPGGTNAVTGVCGAWFDSIPCIFISGQTRLAHTTQDKPIRQLGTQEFNIVRLVKPITKYAELIKEPSMIKYHLQKAFYIAQTGRPGPVWLDIPLDSQWASIQPDELLSFDPSELHEPMREEALEAQVSKCLQLIEQSKRPLILAGYGIRTAHAEAEFRQFVEKCRFPFISSWNASDILPTDYELYVGRPGTLGQRGANLAMQNCDLLLCIGSHLSIALTGTMFAAFTREATRVMIDIDEGELQNETVRVDYPIKADARTFLQEALRQMDEDAPADINDWRNKCRHYAKYNAIPAEGQEQKDYVNHYVFIDTLSDELDSDDIIVADGGGTSVSITFQAFKVKQRQRLFTSSGLCAMGSGLPQSVGACFGSGGKRTICLCSDGGIQLNIQELQTVAHHELPIKIFIANNDGYLSIRHTQDAFLESKYVGSDKSGGVSFPDMVKIAKAYGIRAERIWNHDELREKIRSVLESPGPVLCDVMISRNQQVIPRQGVDKKPDGTGIPRPLEDMYPFLDRKEFLANMIVKPWSNSQ